MAITLKKLSGDTEVIPNPTLDGSETALSGLQIDGVKYAMGGGGGVYQHHVQLSARSGSEMVYANFSIITSDNTQFTQTSLLEFFTSHQLSVAATGIKTPILSTDIYNVYGVYVSSNGRFKISMCKTTENTAMELTGGYDITVTDNVIEV